MRKVTDEITAKAIIESFYPNAKIDPQKKCRYKEFGFLKNHKIDLRISESGIVVGIEVATMHTPSRALLAANKEDLVNLSLIIEEEYNQIDQGIMVFNGQGLRKRDLPALNFLGSKLGIRIVESMGDFMSLCQKGELIAT